MIEKFVARFDAARDRLMEGFRAAHPESYDDIVKRVVEAVSDDHGHREPDPKRIHVIDDGDYQGTRLFVIGSSCYQPDTYWYVMVSYGSCSGCDSLQRIRDECGCDEPPSENQAKQYFAMALHILQSMKELNQYTISRCRCGSTWGNGWCTNCETHAGGVT